jgi:hypothetical protein
VQLRQSLEAEHRKREEVDRQTLLEELQSKDIDSQQLRK